MNIDELEGLDEAARKQIKKLKKVTREKNGCESYAKAQIEKADIYYNFDQFENSYLAFADIKKSDSLIYYMMAQYAMGALLSQSGDSVEAIKVWGNLKGVEDSLIASKIKFRIGNYLLDEKFLEYNEAKQYFIETLKYYPYESYCYQKICNLFSHSRLKV